MESFRAPNFELVADCLYWLFQRCAACSFACVGGLRTLVGSTSCLALGPSLLGPFALLDMLFTSQACVKALTISYQSSIR